MALSAQELSEPIANKHTGAQPIAARYQSDDITHWRQVVEKRIQSKTRRISKVRLSQSGACSASAVSCLMIYIICLAQGASQPVKAVPNRYAPVAGFFFFPLLKNYDRCVYMQMFAYHFDYEH